MADQVAAPTIVQGSIAQEVQQIFNNGANPVHFAWTAQLLANGLKVDISKVLSIDIERDYAQNYADQIIFECQIPAGTYLNLIFPFKDNLLLTLKKTPVQETGGAPIAAGSSSSAPSGIENHQMRAVIMDPVDHQIEANHPAMQSRDTMDLQALKMVRFQLFDLALEQMRMISLGTVIRQTTPGDAVRFIMTAVSNQIKVDESSKILGVDMVAPDNTQTRDHIVLPHGIQFSEVPGWIHEHMGGVYNGGLGCYLQGGHWYVFPPHNTNRFQATPKNLTLLNVPQNQMPNVERTYRTTDNQVIVILTGQNKHMDVSDHKQLNQGNGIRFTDAAKILGGFGVAKDNKFTIDRAKNNSEFVAAPRATGLNLVPTAPIRITANQFFQTSQMAKRMGEHLQVGWENSEPSLIYPGMPCKYVFNASGKQQVRYGTVIHVHHRIAKKTQGIIGGDYRCTSALTLFLDNGSKDPVPASAGADPNATPPAG